MINQIKKKRFWSNTVLLAVSGVGLLVGCTSKAWDKADQDELIERCRLEGGSKSYCNCYLSNAMEKYPNAEDMKNIDFESAVELSIDCE